MQRHEGSPFVPLSSTSGHVDASLQHSNPTIGNRGWGGLQQERGPPTHPWSAGGGRGRGGGGSRGGGRGGGATTNHSANTSYHGRGGGGGGGGGGGEGGSSSRGGRGPGTGGRRCGPQSSYNHPHNPADQGGPSAPPSSWEDICSMMLRLHKREQLPEAHLVAAMSLDSRSLSNLLKELSKNGADGRAAELFDSIRSLPNAPRELLDVYSFTAMICSCIHRQDVDRAMELIEDMKSRGIVPNVHTFTALMNVQIKCGKLHKALQTYESMRSSGCQPNVVTYNTLVDVYGKLGDWERALQVVTAMQREGVTPVLRTWNTLLIACNMCNQPREALGVFVTMQRCGETPNSTTYNALISAYGKIGQLDKAMEVFHTMCRANIERSVITYSSLISACEKAGQVNAALEVFDEMKREGCMPNTVTFNSLLAACAAGGEWQKAGEVFEMMAIHGSSCAPDVVTYTTLISAYERCGEWTRALRTYEAMVEHGCNPDAIVYNAIIDALWETGVVWAQSHALEIFSAATKRGHFKRDPFTHQIAVLNLHAMTAGVAMLALYSWLEDIHRLATGSSPKDDSSQNEQPGSTSLLPDQLLIVLDAGRTSREQGNSVIKEAVSTACTFWESPFKPCTPSSLQLHHTGGGRPTAPPFLSALVCSGADAERWIRNGSFRALMASLFPFSAAIIGGQAKQTDAAAADPLPAANQPDQPSASLGHRHSLPGSGRALVDSVAASELEEAKVSADCQAQFALVRSFEASHGLDLPSMPDAFVEQRSLLVSRILEAGLNMSLTDEVAHDAVQLMDRVASNPRTKNLLSSPSSSSTPPLPVLAIASLVISAKEAGKEVLGGGEFEKATGMPPDAVSNMEWNLRSILSDDAASVSALRCLKIYLGRLGLGNLSSTPLSALAHHAAATTPPQATTVAGDNKDPAGDWSESGQSLMAASLPKDRVVVQAAAYGMTGLGVMMAVEALYDLPLLNCRPSVVAAALLYTERRVRGAIPFWPTMLAKATGYDQEMLLSPSEFSTAVRGAQKLTRSGSLYAQVYRQQTTLLSSDSEACLGPPALLMQAVRATDGPSAPFNHGLVHAMSSPPLLMATNPSDAFMIGGGGGGGGGGGASLDAPRDVSRGAERISMPLHMVMGGGGGQKRVQGGGRPRATYGSSSPPAPPPAPPHLGFPMDIGNNPLPSLPLPYSLGGLAPPLSWEGGSSLLQGLGGGLLAPSQYSALMEGGFPMNNVIQQQQQQQQLLYSSLMQPPAPGGLPMGFPTDEASLLQQLQMNDLATLASHLARLSTHQATMNQHHHHQ